MDDLIAQLGSIIGARVWYSFSGIGGYFNLHKLSYSKLLELARRHSWHSPYDIKEPIQLTKTEAKSLARALERALSQLSENDLLQGKKLVEAEVFKRALEDAIATETAWAESVSAEEYQASKEAGDSELDWLKAFGLVQRANLDYFNVDDIEGKDNNLTETPIIELSKQEQSELGNALLKGVPVPSGGLVSLSLAQSASPKEWFSGIYGRALVARFISFAKAGEYWLIKQQRG